ncbi:MAG TPA: hypothetical protein VHM93_10635 [Candidatus Acidoferrum sp.]|nr:hypothetical protein [Candidatus Acidoferrum sp.]
MARFLRGSMQPKILVVGTCALACLWLQTPIATAQYRGGHPGGGHAGGGARTAPPVFVPPVPHPTIPRPPLIAAPRPMGVDARFHFRPRPINAFVSRRGLFFGAPCFRFGVGFGCNAFWWPNWNLCWGWGFYCNALPLTEYGSENYVTLQPYPVPVYLYGPGEREQVWLYLKDGTVYTVADYWFVNGQVHFIAVEEGGAKFVEHVIGFDEMDVQKTIDVNTRRGFRVVMRDEPMEQYLRDHPDPMPPLLQPTPKS